MNENAKQRCTGLFRGKPLTCGYEIGRLGNCKALLSVSFKLNETKGAKGEAHKQ